MALQRVPMSKVHAAEIIEEPVGIVISRGSRAEPAPRVTSYVWGPAPDMEPSSGEMVAA